MEANWSAINVLLIVTTIAVYVGRSWFKRWFNPLSIYSVVWGFVLCGYELRLIQYEPISLLAWIYIFVAWISLYLGAASVALLNSPSRARAKFPLNVDLLRLRRAIMMLSAIGAIGVVDQILTLQREFGSVFGAVLVSANDLYASRAAGEISTLPYFGSFALGGCGLAGIYTARIGRISIVAIVSMLLVTLQSVFGMGRLELGIGAVLFLTSLYFTPGTKITLPKWQLALAIILALVLLAGGFIFVSSVRGLGVDFPGTTPAMERITEYFPAFPSLYSNFSATPVAFSLYLASPQQRRHDSWGKYTFAPTLRLLSKFGLATPVPPYEENYYTPVPMNTDTYLKNLHSDFGFPGVLIFPYILGGVIAGLIFQTDKRPNLVALMILANVSAVAVFAFLFNIMLLGDWLISAVVGVMGAAFIERKSLFTERRRTVTARHTAVAS